MPGTVYALLVGINDYQGRLDTLAGCVDDAKAFWTFLKGRVPAGSLSVLPFFDQQATRARITDAFSSHLGKAAAGDVAVFFFAGHGSFERVEDRFWFLEPTGRNQTLVCADSRRPGVPDLADKELSVLLDEVSARGPHVLVVLDCCHSGGGTRTPQGLPAGVRVRMAPPAAQVRAVDTYLPAVREAVLRARDAAARPIAGLGRHVALSACESHQLSKEIEYGEDGGSRGVFSSALVEALTLLGPGATYRQLLGAATNRVRNRVGDQSPVSYATEPDDLDQVVLGGTVQAPRSGVTLEHDRDGWWIDAGTVHGVVAPQGTETTVLAVLPPDPAGGDQPLGQVRVTRADPARSQVQADGDWQPDPARRYPAVVVDVPLPPATVELRGEPRGVELVRAALRDSPHVREAANGHGQRFLVVAEAGRLTVARADATPLTSAVNADEAGARTVARRLEHLARWHLIKELDNPGSAIAGQVELEIVPAEKGEEPPRPGEREPLPLDPGGVIRLGYRRTGAGWTKPYVFVHVHNRSDRDLYCALLDLTDSFRCHGKLLPVTRIPAGGSAVAFHGRPIDIGLPQKRIEAGGTQVRDWLKLIAAEQRFEPDAYALPNLDEVVTRGPATRGPGRRSVLDRIGDRVVTRDAGDDEEPAGAPEWTTTTVALVTERPADGVTVPGAGEARLSNGDTDVMTVQGHPGLAGARVVLGTSEQAVRALGVPDVAPPLPAGESRISAVTFSGVRATEDALDHLAVSGDFAADQVTPQQPLRLRLRLPAGDDDLVLAVARDGELFLPLGVGTRSADGEIRLDLVRLPGNEVRVFFQRLAGYRLGTGSGPRLSPAEAGTGRVLLLVHAVPGGTETVLAGLRESVGDAYDTVLAFDADSVGTTVEQNAAALADGLARAGVNASAGRRLDVVAHSIGALVARWWLERGGGADVTRRVVLTGVPNAGTLWARAPGGWATGALALGLNQTVPAAVLGGLAGIVERAGPGTGGLEPDPATGTGEAGVACTVVAGQASPRLRPLLARFGAAPDESGDLLVSAASMRTPGAVVRQVPCDHLTYFQEPQALAAVAAALTVSSAAAD
ncbi:caspase family protein [Actinoplanes aureus]|uniref:Caspase family protein n=1 Tax=Actinoplanes aureus TaxID=2792083 RepID=A0A931G043_9ACTN|nr:caspase family protein [Actinoplanes aureus]MBG0565470.1 caspase family protein [Actinoplanes aureus]